MRPSTAISCVKNVQAGSSVAKVWRRQCAGAAAREEGGSMKTSESVREGDLAPVSEASRSSSSGNQLPRFAQPRHERTSPQFASFQNRNGASIRRTWRHASHATQGLPQEKFVITSFNILASSHAWKHQSLYDPLSSYHLAWHHRKKKVLQNLDFCSPDIICLQEVEQFQDLKEELTCRGYAGLYKARTGEMPDGCAIFWRVKRFQLLQERSFEFFMLGMRHNVAQLCVLQLIVPEMANNSRNERQTQKYLLVVGNIHVLYNPKRGEIKLGQCRAFLEQVHNMSSIWHGAPIVIGGDFNSTPSSAIYKYLATSELDLFGLDRKCLSGLIPKVPTCVSAAERSKEETLVELSMDEVASQKLEMGMELFVPSSETISEEGVSYGNQMNPGDSNLIDRSTESLTIEEVTMELSPPTAMQACCDATIRSCTKKGSVMEGWNGDELRIATGKAGCTLMQHDLNLKSAYCDIRGSNNAQDSNGEPVFTSCHKGFQGTVDYIWRGDGLKTTRVLETLPGDAFANNKSLPIKIWGSDHLPLACELAFT